MPEEHFREASAGLPDCRIAELLAQKMLEETAVKMAPEEKHVKGSASENYLRGKRQMEAPDGSAKAKSE